MELKEYKEKMLKEINMIKDARLKLIKIKEIRKLSKIVLEAERLFPDTKITIINE